MEIDERYLSRVVKTLARAIAHERIENYALRTLLIDPADADASIDIQNKARELATKRYQNLLRLVDDEKTENVDLMRFLDDFGALMRRE